MTRGANPDLAAALGKIILVRCTELSRSQEDVAHESGMCTRQNQRIEAGQAVNALVGNVYSIALALYLKLAELADRAERDETPPPINRPS